MRGISILVCAWLGCSAAAFADDCPEQNQNGLNRCAEDAYKKADAALNGVYRQITQRLKDDAETAKLLVGAQKAWIAFRDAECTFANSSNAGGSIYPMVYSGCLSRLTKARTKELAGYLNCAEGDMGCPVPGQ
jgi:uncharacterized protein YecT (DUF1311 family)